MKGLKETSLYNSWQGMKKRCQNPNNPKYYRYGGRGIKVCKEWQSIEGFYSWAINNGWKQGLSIDRIDNDKDYCPENCRWVSVSENSKKKSTTKISDEDAVIIRNTPSKTYKELALEYNVNPGTIWFIKKGVTHL